MLSMCQSHDGSLFDTESDPPVSLCSAGMNSSLFTSAPANNLPSNYPPSNWQVPTAKLQQQPPAQDNWSWLDQLEGNT